MTKKSNDPYGLKRRKALKTDRLFVAEFDDTSGAYCVFGVETGFAYASYASREEAMQEATKMNRQKNYH